MSEEYEEGADYFSLHLSIRAASRTRAKSRRAVRKVWGTVVEYDTVVEVERYGRSNFLRTAEDVSAEAAMPAGVVSASEVS